ncbi:MAG: tetratricopeptide repeat protein, partial [Chloroflexota bacterium]|nr:tetratricopeptide repeat protein [Chloroflexota bacterium]
SIGKRCLVVMVSLPYQPANAVSVPHPGFGVGAPFTPTILQSHERRPSKEIAARLAGCLQLAAEEEPAFIRFARGESSVHQPAVIRASVETAPWRPQARPPSNLPIAPTTFIGREHEVAAVSGLLRRADVRLLTLTGPGGIGKTRLGLQVAEALRDDYPDGIWFVALASISEPDLIVSAIAQVLGVKEMATQPLLDAVQNHLGDKRLLLVLDNFEQILTAAPTIGSLLHHAPFIKVLVTSREPLHLAGEQEFPVPPLALPTRGALPAVEALSQYPAVALFLQRAQSVLPTFQITSINAPAMAEICHRLDGLPLAIELAAARVKLLTPQALLTRLGSRLGLLSSGARDLPERHQALRTTIDWSYQLLTPSEQVLFTQLAVFVGGWTLEAAEAVCTASGDLAIDVVDGVQSLLDKSLLRRDEVDGTPRFSMLETIHEYACEKLAVSGDEAVVRYQHASFFLQLVETAERESSARHQAQWLAQLEAEHDNLRVALDWALARDEAEFGLRLSGSLSGFWLARGLLSEGRQRLAAVLSLTSVAPRSLRAKTLTRAGLLAYIQCDYHEARILYEESQTIYHTLQGRAGKAGALVGLAHVALDQSEFAQAKAFYQEALAVQRQLGYGRVIVDILHGLGRIATMEADYRSAQTLLVEALTLARAAGDANSTALVLAGLGKMLWVMDDVDEALTTFEESVALYHGLGDKSHLASVFAGMGSLFLGQGKQLEAQAMFRECLVIGRQLGVAFEISQGLYGLGMVALAQGEYRQAEIHLHESLGLAETIGHKYGMAHCIAALAAVAASQRQDQRAALLWAASSAMCETMGIPLAPTDCRLYEPAVVGLRWRHNQEAWADAKAAMQTMTLEQVTAYARQAVGTTLKRSV